LTHHRARLVAGALLLATTVTIASLVTFVGEPPFDLRLVREAAAWRDGATGEVMDTASDYGYGLWLAPASFVIALLLAWFPHRRRDAAIVALTTTTAVILTRLLKETFERTRPEGAHHLVAGFSMPSGHATSAAAFAASLVFVLPRTPLGHLASAVLVLGALVVGASRVVLGVHYPSDVVAGFCSGVGVALLVSVLADRVPERGVRTIVR
jgi:undecaprenyl-diphosphatase